MAGFRTHTTLPPSAQAPASGRLPQPSPRNTYFEEPSNHPIEHIPLRLATDSNAANEEEVWSGILRVRKYMQVKNRWIFSDPAYQGLRLSQNVTNGLRGE